MLGFIYLKCFLADKLCAYTCVHLSVYECVCMRVREREISEVFTQSGYNFRVFTILSLKINS